MKKFIVGGLVAAAAAVPAVALAQSPEPVVRGEGKLSSTNAGTARKPTPVKFTFLATNSAASQTTVSRIQLDMPVGVRLDGSRLDTCTFATLNARGPAGCKAGAKLGEGVAYAFLVNKADPNPPDCVALQGNHPRCLTFTNTFYVGGKRLMSIWLQQRGGNVQKALQGRISTNGRRITIDIPRDLQSPAPSLYSALLQLQGSWQKSKRVGGRTYSFVSTTACPRGRQWAFRTTFFYVPNPTAPPVSSRAGESQQACRA